MGQGKLDAQVLLERHDGCRSLPYEESGQRALCRVQQGKTTVEVVRVRPCSWGRWEVPGGVCSLV